MKFEMDADFHGKLNIFAKLFLYIGFIFVDVGMKLAGLEPKREK